MSITCLLVTILILGAAWVLINKEELFGAFISGIFSVYSLVVAVKFYIRTKRKDKYIGHTYKDMIPFWFFY